MKSNPKTIADLKINWEFDYDSLKHENEYVADFNANNEHLTRIKIKPGLYHFQYNDRIIDLLASSHYEWELGQFFWILNYQLRVYSYQYLDGKGYCITIPSFELKKFEFISENTFKIHAKKPLNIK